MRGRLKDHPFAVTAYLQKSVVLTFSMSAELLQKMIPVPFTVDTFNDDTGFVAVAMVQTTGLRPAGFPKFLGNDFFLIGYRIFVRYQTSTGKNLRRLYILRSETDSNMMKMLGSIFTTYKYEKIAISHEEEDGRLRIVAKDTGFELNADVANDELALPANSVFTSWKEARRFAGPLPFTFSYNNSSKQVLIVQGVREHWVPAALKVETYNVPYLNTPEFATKKLASAFVIRDIPYRWEKGRIEQWGT